MIPFSDLLARFSNVRASGNAYRCKCPAHNQDGTSLIITCKEGVILIHCFGGCSTWDVLAAVGLRMKDISRAEENSKFGMRDLIQPMTPRERFMHQVGEVLSLMERKHSSPRDYGRTCKRWSDDVIETARRIYSDNRAISLQGKTHLTNKPI